MLVRDHDCKISSFCLALARIGGRWRQGKKARRSFSWHDACLDKMKRSLLGTIILSDTFRARLLRTKVSKQ